MDFLRKIWSYLRVFGLRATAIRAVQKLAELAGLRRAEQHSLSVSSADLLAALATAGEAGLAGHVPVDIIVPVFDGFDLLRPCTEALLRNSENCHVLFVNDASTDDRVAPYLTSLVADTSRNVAIDYMENEANSGFVVSVNRGLHVATHDVVILNTDTEVPPRWLERILAPIVADPEHVASVTPMSNSATICSFPLPVRNNELFLGLAPDVIDSYFGEWGCSDPVDIPTGVGFCMAMSRNALDAVGNFDEVTFGRGYGEENDWCMRAWRAGFRNVAAPNLFVCHHDGGSFASHEKDQLLAEHQRILEARYPDMVRLLSQFRREDPLQVNRAALAWRMAISEPGSVVRHAVVDIDMEDAVGGSIEYRRWLVHSLVSRGDLVIQFLGIVRSHAIRVVIDGPRGSIEFLLDAASEADIGALIEAAGVSDILVNGLITYAHPDQVAEQLASRPETKVFAVHDYTTCCPSYRLLNSRGMCCHGEVDLEVCGRCLSAASMRSSLLVPVTTESDLARWRQAMKGLLDSCSSVVCFSSDSERQLRHVYPGVARIEVIEHSLRIPASFRRRELKRDDRQLIVATIGYMFPSKGGDIIAKAATLASARGLPVQFWCVGQWAGHTGRLESRSGRLHVTGAYRREDLPQFLEQSGASLVVVPSIWPETFSYTTSEAILLGYPVVCFDLGAPADRVRMYDCGMVVQDVSAEGMLDALKGILDHPDLIEYWSHNTARYSPPTEAEHINAILRCLGEHARQADDSPTVAEEGRS